MIENIKGISHLDLDLSSSNGGAKNWLLLFGDNGYCKTTVIRAIALGLGDKDDISGMFTEHEGSWVKKDSGSDYGRIHVDFYDPSGDLANASRTIKIKHKNGREWIDDIDSQPSISQFPYSKVFACGYGAGRGAVSASTKSDYRYIDAIYSLFDYTTELQDPELSLRRLEDLGARREAITRWIDRLLMLEEGSTVLDANGLSVPSLPNLQLKLPFGVLSDGYKSVITFVSDFLGRSAQFHKRFLHRTELGGVVLVDELDQHLHPNWQRRIVGLLHQQFPNVQFLTTTHSPLCALGTTELETADVELAVMNRSDEGIGVIEDLATPVGKRADQVLTSILFQMASPWDDETQELIDRFAKLNGTSSERSGEVQEIERVLEQRLGSSATELQEIARRAVDYALDSLVDDLASDPESVRTDTRLLEYEVIRRLTTLKKQ